MLKPDWAVVFFFFFSFSPISCSKSFQDLQVWIPTSFLSFFLSLFLFNTPCLWKCWKWVRREAAVCVWGEDGFARHAPHTASDAFLIKSGFPPATGAEIKGAGGEVLSERSFIWPRFTCGGGGSGGGVSSQPAAPSSSIPGKTWFPATPRIVVIPPARLLAESHSNPQIFVRGSQSCFTYWAAPGTKKNKKKKRMKISLRSCSSL